MPEYSFHCSSEEDKEQYIRNHGRSSLAMVEDVSYMDDEFQYDLTGDRPPLESWGEYFR